MSHIDEYQAETARMFQDVYEWADAQPGISRDFVAVPIESLAELLRGNSPLKYEPKDDQ